MIAVDSLAFDTVDFDLPITCISLFTIFIFRSVAFNSPPSADVLYQYYITLRSLESVYSSENGLFCISPVSLAIV